VAFLPSNVVPGIDFSNDPLLQGRLFSYLDTQKSRLGTTNFHQIPINAPKCPFANFQRDGMMQTAVPKGRANYEPNSLAEAGEEGGPREIPDQGFTSFSNNAEHNDPSRKLRIRAETFADHYSQARLFYRSQTPVEQSHIVMALVFELSKVSLEHVRTRMLSRLLNIDEELAHRVAKGLSMPLPAKSAVAKEPVEMPLSDHLSLLKKFRPTMKGRKIGILFAEGSDGAIIKQLVDEIHNAGGQSMLIAPKIGGLELMDGTILKADGQLAGTPSVLFDAIAVVVSAEAAQKLAQESAAVDFVRDAYGHLKAIGCDDQAAALLHKAGIEIDEGITDLGSQFIQAAAIRFFTREPRVRDPLK
jgi:catalase